MDPLLVILDLDETLVHVPEHPLSRSPDFTAVNYPVYVRPHLDEFLEGLHPRYRVAVWTTANRVYAEAIVSKIIPWSRELAFFWCAEQCTKSVDREGRVSTIKELREVERRGDDLARVLIVDDSPEKHRGNVDNLIPIRAYCGDVADNELPALLPFLHTLDPLANVRSIDKRAWRSRASGG